MQGLENQGELLARKALKHAALLMLEQALKDVQSDILAIEMASTSVYAKYAGKAFWPESVNLAIGVGNSSTVLTKPMKEKLFKGVERLRSGIEWTSNLYRLKTSLDVLKNLSEGCEVV